MLDLDPQTIDAAIRSCTAEGEIPFSGVVRIRQGGEVLFEAGYGLARRAEGIPNTPDLRYATASGCKIFTAVSVLQLVAAGRFALETPLRDVLDIPYALDPAVTVRHLLTHTSGLPDYYDEEELEWEDCLAIWEEKPVYTLRQPEDYLPLFMDRPPKFAPGARFAYNNGAYVLLALLVKQHAANGRGQDFPDYVQEHVFAPAGMADSGYFRLDQLPARVATGYIPNEDGTFRTNIYTLPPIGGGDGGAYVTAADWGGFWDALYAERLLPPDLTAAMLTPHVDTGHKTLDQHYGYGVWIMQREGDVFQRLVMGSDFGVGMASVTYPAAGLDLTLLANIEETVWPAWGAVGALLDTAL